MKITIEYDIEVETHNRTQFQAEGHMLFGLYGPGNTPDAPPIPRKWTGLEVFIATLKNPQGSQAIRVMSDSSDDALELMKAAIRDTLYANARAGQAQQFDYQQFLKLNAERNDFQSWVDAKYPFEVARDWDTPNGRGVKYPRFGSVFELAKYYLTVERSRAGVRLSSLFRRKGAK